MNMEEQIVKYLSGDLSQEQEEDVREWRNESVENSTTFFDYEQVWKIAQNREVDTKSSLNLVMDRIDFIESDKVKSVKLPWLKYAAAVAMVALGLIYWGQNILDQSLTVVETTDVLKTVELPDGSRITLSPNSSLSYSTHFTSSNRIVDLDGKAFFDVKRDETRPFIVQTSQSKVEVLGTSFLVNTKDINASTVVIVKSGHVVVNKNNEEGKLDLLAGDVGRLIHGENTFTKTAIENENYLAWKTKILSFENEKMETVIATINDVYGVDVKWSNASLLNCEISAKFNKQPVEAVLEIISITFNFTLTKTGDMQYLLTGSGCK